MKLIGSRLAAFVASLLLAGLILPAMPQDSEQNKEQRQMRQEKTFNYQVNTKDGQTIFYSNIEASGQGATDHYLFSELSMEKTATGKPYSADAITEFTQVLGDGNRIYRKTAARLYRDSQGRTRREEPIPGGASEGQMIVISDPVAGMNYALNPSMQTAQKTSRSVVKILTSKIEGAGEVVVAKSAPEMGGEPPMRINLMGGPAGGAIVKYESRLDGVSQEKQEALGTQIIEGIQTEGTRTTVTIPAGTIGNQLPIEIISERWYSPDLELVVMSTQRDPRVGETIYRMTNINRSEPSASLFEVPADYKVMHDRPGKRD